MHLPTKPEITARIISGDEVMEWFARGHKPWPTEKDCADIAARLTKVRWPGEELPAIGDDEQWQIDYPSWPDGPPVFRRVPYKADPWWDPEKAATAARVLLHDFPAMLWHWRGMRHTRAETLPGQKPARLREGYAAIKRLGDALEAALPYVEFPFGKYRRQDHREGMRLKPWHVHAVAITPMIVETLRRSGHPIPAHLRKITHNTAAVRIVREALVRMGYDKNIIKPPAIAQFLTLWANDSPGRFF